jgi:hypothetical protein
MLAVELGRFPSQCVGISGSGWLAFTQRSYGCVRESQLRGSGGVSPRFPNIPNRDKGFMWNGWTYDATPQGKRVSLKFEAWVGGSQSELQLME